MVVDNSFLELDAWLAEVKNENGQFFIFRPWGIGQGRNLIFNLGFRVRIP